MNEISVWFGRVDLDRCIVLSKNDTQSPQSGRPESTVPQTDLRALAKMLGVVESDYEYNRLLRDYAILSVIERLKALANDEAELLQMIEALDDINFALNLLEERLSEWSRLKGDSYAEYPAPESLITGNETEEGGIGIMYMAVDDLRKRRSSLEGRVSSAALNLSPNLSSIAGPLLAARLISHAGGLKRLSQMPSSAIQIMGADRAIFKHLKGRAPSPKHGIIYRHPLVMRSQRMLRGKIARALAGKLAIAARLDQHSGALNPDLKTALNRRVLEIKGRHKERPRD